MIHLGERECSLQRRHQKVIEEAPSPFLDDATAPGDGRAGGGAGPGRRTTSRPARWSSSSTPTRNFYFLEMNTRLQVEHPVTEFVTGLDLVELMIRIAAGETLPIDAGRRQAQRLGDRGPRLRRRSVPQFPAVDRPAGALLARRPESESVRVDTGVYEGGEVSIHYDPMIAKLITHGGDARPGDRPHARSAQRVLHPRRVAQHQLSRRRWSNTPAFREGRLSTNMIAEEYPDGFQCGRRCARRSARC